MGPGTFEIPQWGGLESPRVLGGLWTRSFDTPSEITQNHVVTWTAHAAVFPRAERGNETETREEACGDPIPQHVNLYRSKVKSQSTLRLFLLGSRLLET